MDIIITVAGSFYSNLTGRRYIMLHNQTYTLVLKYYSIGIGLLRVRQI
jgi:hypothetical protein